MSNSQVYCKIHEFQDAILTHQLARSTLQCLNATQMEQIGDTFAYTCLASMIDLPPDEFNLLWREELTLFEQKKLARESYLKSIASMEKLLEGQRLIKIAEDPELLSQIEKCKKQLLALEQAHKEKTGQITCLTDAIDGLTNGKKKSNKVQNNLKIELKKKERTALNDEVEKLSKKKKPFLEQQLFELESKLKSERLKNEEALQTCQLRKKDILSHVSTLQQQTLKALQRIVEIQFIFIEHLKNENIDPEEAELMSQLTALKEKAKMLT